MNYFININLILYSVIIITALLAASIFFNDVQLENYNYFNTFFCSGWAGDCL